jgi:hypothetical protein
MRTVKNKKLKLGGTLAFEPDNLLIVGAGFSFNAGLPLASGFTKELLNIAGLKLDGPSSQQVEFIREFVDRAFGEGESRSADQWPELEDIFTLVDLSANTGHHLGPKYSASELRTVRRAIIVRMIRMLSQVYTRRKSTPDPEWELLESLFEDFNIKSSAVLSMNWDTVFERGLDRTQSVQNVDYGCGASAYTFSKGRLRRQKKKSSKVVRILKPHGSVNWLYCDSCREMFWVPPNKTEHVAQTLFRGKDWEAVQSATDREAVTILEPACPHCEGNALGTRFATFSYRKALDFPMHAGSWRTAEEYLKCARNWIFFGYSMPFADFEFKLLLKRVQLSEPIRPSITIITGGDDADSTIQRFEKFFGVVPHSRTYFKEGLTSGVLDHLRSIGVLKNRSS